MNKSILIINNDSVSLKYYASSLSKFGYSVLFSNSIENGFSIITHKKPNLSVLFLDSFKGVNIQDLNDLSNNLDLPLLIFSFDIGSEQLYANQIGHLKLLNEHEDKLENINKIIIFLNDSVFKHYNFLIVEDNELNQELYSCFLSHPNVSVYFADTQEKAISVYNDFKIDLVITDAKLKYGSGIDFYKETIKLNNSNTPFLLLSGYTLDELLDIYGYFDIKCCLSKPISKNQILKFVNSIFPGLYSEFSDTNNVISNYSLSQIVNILKGNKDKIKSCISEYIGILSKASESINMALVNNDVDALRSYFHDILNLTKYFSAGRLEILINEFRKETNIKLKMEKLSSIKIEINNLLNYLYGKIENYK